MGISAFVGQREFEIGTPSFFKSFFSTIFVRLESESWGARFPIVMRQLYAGRVSSGSCLSAASELQLIRYGLSSLPPTSVVWDFEAREARPPWGSDISPDIHSMAQYFVTSDGRSLIHVLEEACDYAAGSSNDLEIG